MSGKLPIQRTSDPLHLLAALCETFVFFNIKLKKKNSVALAREQTIPTERLPNVSEVSANFCG
jgi:hypothetical protein